MQAVSFQPRLCAPFFLPVLFVTFCELLCPCPLSVFIMGFTDFSFIRFFSQIHFQFVIYPLIRKVNKLDQPYFRPSLSRPKYLLKRNGACVHTRTHTAVQNIVGSPKMGDDPGVCQQVKVKQAMACYAVLRIGLQALSCLREAR